MRVLIFLVAVLPLFACKLQHEHSEQKWGRTVKGTFKSADQVKELVAKAMKQDDIDSLRGLVKGANSVAAIQALRTDIMVKFAHVDNMIEEFGNLQKSIRARNPNVTDVTSTSPLAKAGLDEADKALDELLDEYESHLALAYRIADDAVLRAKIIVGVDDAQLAKWENIIRTQRTETLEKIARVKSLQKSLSDLASEIDSHLKNRNFAKIRGMAKNSMDNSMDNSRSFSVIFTSVARKHEQAMVELMLSYNAKSDMLNVEKAIGRLAEISSGQQAAQITNEITDSLLQLAKKEKMVLDEIKFNLEDTGFANKISKSYDNTIRSELSHVYGGKVLITSQDTLTTRWTIGLTDAVADWQKKSANLYVFDSGAYRGSSVYDMMELKFRTYENIFAGGTFYDNEFDLLSSLPNPPSSGWEKRAK